MTNLKDLRKRKGWSQQELATRAGVGIHTVGRMEAGEEVLKSSVKLVAQALGVKPDEIDDVTVVNRVLKSGKK